MRTRSSHNWNFRAGGMDALNASLIWFEGDFPVLNCHRLLDTQVPVIHRNPAQGHSRQGSIVSMLLDDYKLEKYWNNPKRYISQFLDYDFVMSPDYSLLVGMPYPMAIWSVYKNRFVGGIWQEAGVNIVPTVSWSDESSFEYCFKGIAQGSVVAVSNTGCRNDEHKGFFDRGFEEMKRQIAPKQIVFQCTKKLRQHYEAPNVYFIDSFWDMKRQRLKNN